VIDLADDELIIDSFAGGGGASTGIAAALGRAPDVAINHDPEAVALHAANHPATLHLCQSVWKMNPEDVVAAGARHRGIDPSRARVGLLWASPDCKHFSVAKGGKPVEKNIRDLAWIVVHYARQVRPRVILLENVPEFRTWGPLITTEDGKTKPCPLRKGVTFRAWVRELKKCGYVVETRELRACDYGAPTIRKRLFLIARCDGKPIVWPAATHAKDGAGGLRPWRSAAEIIDWSLPTPSIFLTREEGRRVGANRPLAEATMARIARGVKRYVLDAPLPFIVPVTHQGDFRVHDAREPLRTVTTAKRGELALVAPHVTKFRGGATGAAMDEPLPTVTANSHTAQGREGGAPPLGVVAATMVQTGYGERRATYRCLSCDETFHDAHATGIGGLAPAECPKCGEEKEIVVDHPGQSPRALDLEEPLGTVVAGGAKHAAVAAFLAQHNGGMVGHDAREPVSTLTGTCSHQTVVAAHISDLHGTAKSGHGASAPVATIAAGGTHHALVAAFLAKYYGEGSQDQAADAPAHTIPTKARLAAVTVTVDGITYAIADIGMRMLTPRELYRAQGFPDSYRIDEGPEGKRLSKAAQIRMCGNSVCPPLAEALARAQFGIVQKTDRSAA